MPVSINSSIYEPSDYIESSFLLNSRFDNRISTHSRTMHLGGCTPPEVLDFLQELMPDSTIIADTGESDSVSHIVTDMCWSSVTRTGDMITVKAKGDKTEVERISSAITTKFPKAPTYIRWMVKQDGDSIKLPVDNSSVPSTSFYPQLGTESLTEYYDRFVSSRANVLVLFGPPGTGKTSFIRGFLLHTGMNAIVSYDPAILERDSIFSSFLSGREDVMILEDADSFLGARSKGNTVMHRFLNVGDGLISTRRKKLIFTTNLPTIKDVDQALLRPGRCFDILHFRNLDPAEARQIDPTWPGTEPVSLAELFNGTPTTAVKRVGFAP